jgi:peptidyl-prolyl cis-trans isomerase A (cyclophilin A)
VRRLTLLSLGAALVLVPAACGGGGAGKQTGPPAALLHPAKLHAKAPQIFTATFETTKGTFEVEVHRSWASQGADRFYNLVENHFYDGAKFFRVVPHFVVQFGISPYPSVSEAWRNATIPDDLVTNHNTRGGVTFASAGPNTRTTQIFINLGDNRSLDTNGFAPFGAVTKGMDVVDKLYSGYGDQPSGEQGSIETEGNAWLDKHYPKLDSIETAKVTSTSP